LPISVAVTQFFQTARVAEELPQVCTRVASQFRSICFGLAEEAERERERERERESLLKHVKGIFQDYERISQESRTDWVEIVELLAF